VIEHELNLGSRWTGPIYPVSNNVLDPTIRGGRQPCLDFTSLQEVTIDIESTMKDSQNIDIS
jgi:hypothetical protein